MASQVFGFDTPSNYTLSDSDKLQITLGEAILKLFDDPDNDFNEDFADDTDFTYESDLSEFSGGQSQQKDQRQTGATFGASYTNDINGSWGDGVLTGTANGGAAVSGGKLDLTGGGVKYVDYDADLNADSQQVGCVRLKYTPNYTGYPPSDYPVFSILKADANTNNIIMLRHETGGVWKVFIEDYTGSNIMSASLPSWSATSGIEVELELNWDLTTGATRLFIDGSQWGTTQTDTGTRDSSITILRIGSNYNGVQFINCYIDDVLIFPTVQHTSNYTKGYSVADYIYLESSVLLPEMHYIGAGTLIEATDFQTSYSGSPRIAIDIGQSGEYTYWNGSAWVTGGDDYDHATSPADFLTNIATLPVTGETYGQFIIYYPDSNTQSAFSDLTITLTSQIYPTDNPYLDINSRWYIDELEAITAVKTVTGSDQVKLALKKGTQFYYVSGGVLTESDGTYSQSNTVEEWETYKALFTSIKVYIGIRVFLHSDDGTTTPSIDTLTVQYSYAGDTPDTVDKCIVWGTFIDEVGDPMIGPIQVVLTDLVAQYKTGTMIRRKSPAQEMELDSTGYGEIELVETENMTGSQTYTFQFDNNVIRKRQVPNQATANFFDLTE